jgi:hypothetical protein
LEATYKEAAMPIAIVVLSDPRSGSDDALGRVFNALAAAYDFKANGEAVTLLFQGAGTRWVGELAKAENPAHDLFEQVRDVVAGVSCGCANVFGATDDAVAEGLALIKDNPVPGTGGLPSLRSLLADGHTVLTF